jgi:hypothetical protein
MQGGDAQQKCHDAADCLTWLLIGIIYSGVYLLQFLVMSSVWERRKVLKVQCSSV